ncbi:amino acid ABC transporter permease [Bosea caraganae]|uniref:Amino acid ABC transporter permease n=1 Tax=Bosea caraganae TaxID=2763117 RepID=A0A370KZS5_9HYPH|nr:amino acid ABC transporter permease [Bosea caraganae]RDJ20102.1 amino acid ABC transporter permease [Bosea caraganae]RDJ24814.1 amino acid ABC transporter permease [Bosea caraganae]
MGYEFDWSGVLNLKLWGSALSITLSYAAATIIGGMLIGVVLGVLMLSPRLWVRAPASGYVQLFRCTPLMVQIVWFYYALPIIAGFSISAWIAGGLGLTLYMGAFCAEIFRAGVISIDKGQWNAARALGMSYLKMMRHIILPQAARRMVPPFVNQSVLQLKNTSLLYVVAVPDLMYKSYEIAASTYRPLETYTVVAFIYFLILYPLTKLAKRLEARVDR